MAIDIITKGIIDAYLPMSLTCEDIYNSIICVKEGIGGCYFLINKIGN
jgi:hypothetical protein